MFIYLTLICKHCVSLNNTKNKKFLLVNSVKRYTSHSEMQLFQLSQPQKFPIFW